LTTGDAGQRAGGGARTGTPDPPIRRLFIANRGEVAERIRRTCERLGIEAVVPRLDGAESVDLLDIRAVVDAARQAGADAVHPGYGFLAESADFAAAVTDAAIRWIGPPPAAMRAMGDKAAARRLARDRGIPIAAGYDGADQTDGALAAAAAAIGWPLLVKPAAGGGGKGMRVVRTADRLPDALATARREAQAAFGDDRLVLERYVERARHVEIQVLFDDHGAGVHLGERDCSIQRRHQKVLEETPSPAVSASLRRRLGSAALTLAGAVGYASAGTCEFLVDGRGRFFFLEMNTRLQVEHPVTELVTGRDLVADQIAIAAGATLGELGTTQASIDDALARGGHAIEVRLYAEDAEAAFLPATGTVLDLRWPAGEGIRVDAGIEIGTEVGRRFDPMLAKIVAHGSDREHALERLTGALDETLVLGLTTNLRFLRWLVRQPAILDGLARTDTLERIWPPDDPDVWSAWPGPEAIPGQAWQAAAKALGGGAWRLNGPPVARLVAEGVERVVRLAESAPATAPAAVAVAVDGDGAAHVDLDGRSVPFRIAPPPDVGVSERAAIAAHHDGGSATVAAPMPGLVLAVHELVGSTVDAGDPLVTLEAMKMEHTVAAPLTGRVAELAVAAGEQVARGQVLVVVEPL
jgi:acetyl/propionyl-CoA carboxylase alpha subunit